MAGYKVNMIIDGDYFKLTYTKDGKQQKSTIGRVNDITVMAAQKIAREVESLLESDWTAERIKEMYALNRDTKRCGYNETILQYENKSIEIATKILFQEQYDEIINGPVYPLAGKGKKPLEILNIGCTGSGKTRFIISSILTKKAQKNFVPALTSLKETTACSIEYHVNSNDVELKRDTDFKVEVYLKNKEEVVNSIKGLVTESADEIVETVKVNAKNQKDISELSAECIAAAGKRLEMNYDKTFGLGKRKENQTLAVKVMDVTKKGLMGYCGYTSKSIEKQELDNPDYILQQLRSDFEKDAKIMTHDDIIRMLDFCNIEEMIDEIYNELINDLQKYNDEYNENVEIGYTIHHYGDSEDESTLLYLSHVFGNKRMQRKDDFFTIEPLISRAVFYVKTQKLAYNGEVILSDSVGINQGQKDVERIKGTAKYTVGASVQTRKPDIVLYHTKFNHKDDFMLAIVDFLREYAYGGSTYVVAGRLDEVLDTYIKDNSWEAEDMTQQEFEDILDEVKDIYIESEVTLKSIIGNNYLICDKTNNIVDKYEFAEEYTGEAVLNKVIKENESMDESTDESADESACRLSDVDFMEMIQRNSVPANVYQAYLQKIPDMIPMEYRHMRWNTLQKAIECLRWNQFGFDVLYPAFAIGNAVAAELGRDDIREEFSDKFGDNAEKMKRTYLEKVNDTAQIVLVTEYRELMRRLLGMRYDSHLRTNLSLSMTDDRKHELQKLYQTCMRKNGLQGEHVVKVIMHIAWIRTVDSFEQNV